MFKKITYLLILFFVLYAPSSQALGTQCPLGKEETPICPDNNPNCPEEEKAKFCKKYCPLPFDMTDANGCPESKKVRTPVTMFQNVCQADNTVFKPDKLTGNLIRCAQKLVFKAGDRLIIGYTSMFASWIHYIVILAIVFFGIKMMFGQAMEKGITLVMIAKITLVLYLTSFPGTIRLLQVKDALYQSSSNLVINILRVPDSDDSFFKQAIDISSLFGGLSSMTCTPEGRILGGAIPANAPGGSGTINNSDGTTTSVTVGGWCSKNLGSVFDEIDEILFNFYGLTEEQAASTDPKKKGFNGMIALIVGIFFTGSIGLTVTMVFVTYFLAIAFAIAQIMMLFIVSMIAINFLVAIAPIAMAGILFDQTKRMTKVWFSYLLTYTILPVVLAAFVWVIGVVLYGVKKDIVYMQARGEITNILNNMKSKPVLANDACIATGGDNADKKIANSIARSLTSGTATAADFAFGSEGCLNMKVVSLAPDNATTEEKNTSLDRKELNSLVSVKLGLIIFFLIIVSMIKELPRMAAAIAGNAASGAADIAAKPTQFVESKINAAGKNFGIKPKELLGKK